MAKGLKIAKAARRHHIGREVIYAFIRKGLLTRQADGTIDPAELDALFPHSVGLGSEQGGAPR
jgi:hypothetical protein